MGVFIDRTGQRFGRLTVTRRTANSARNQATWVCTCDCGNTTEVLAGNLQSGRVLSCGCQRSADLVRRNTTHGMSGVPEYSVWCGMIDRCSRKGNRSFKDYGGRGIHVCRRWRQSFEAFLADMGQRPGPGWSIERKKVNKGYHKKNCVWATPVAQARNTRRNHVISHDGKTMCIRDWEIHLGFTKGTISSRLYLGWSEARAVSAPMRKKP